MKKKSNEAPITKSEICGETMGNVQVSPVITGFSTSRTLPRTTATRDDAPEGNRKAQRRAALLATLLGAVRPRPAFAAAAALLATFTVAACVEPATTGTTLKDGATSVAHAHASGGLTSDQRAAIASVRHVTEQYHNIDKAIAAGYTAQYPVGCAASPAGGQGYHYLNPSLVDARVELLKPELVMYEPQPNGQMQLVGVDYVVPFTAWNSDEPPTLLGMPFMRNEPLGVWALHIWNWRPNPSGMFAMWNPRVSCANAN